MSKDPAILFYTGDFLNGCTDLTFEERGQYITLLCLQHQKGHLSEKTIRLTVGSASSDVMSKFIKDENGNYFNGRMDEEIDKRQHFLDTRYFNGKKGGRPKEANNKPNKEPNSKPTNNLSENENENRNEDISVSEKLNIAFQIFWDLYGKKEDRIKCERKWSNLTNKERELCIEKLPAYIESTPDLQFRKNPATYLNNKSWENEIIKPVHPERRVKDGYYED